jgi:CheY-specific phosphatase CheX
MTDEIDIHLRLQEQLVEPLTAAICAALRDMAGIEAAPTDLSRSKRREPPHEVAILLRLQSDLLEGLVLSATDSSAQELARRMLPDAKEGDNTLIRDCLGEIANITAGQAKALLHGSPYHFTFSTPLTLTGNEKELIPQAGECLAIELQSEIGPFALQLWMRHNISVP